MKAKSSLKKIRIKVPGKIIISGEHSVVYGHPAVVAAVNRFITLTAPVASATHQDFFKQLLADFAKYTTTDVINQINDTLGGDSSTNGDSTTSSIQIESEIPFGCGMGSSAALASALSLYCLKMAKLNDSPVEINKYAYQLEKQAHHNPSGVDNTIVTFGGIIKFNKEVDGTFKFSKLPKNAILDELILVNTGRPVENTSQMVQIVRQLKEQKPAYFNQTISQIAHATNAIIDQINSPQANPIDQTQWLQNILNNEDGLEKLGVVSSSCREFIAGIKERGGCAKISGAGGQQLNSGMVIVYPGGDKNLQDYIIKSGYHFSPLSIDGGIKYEFIER